MGTTGSFRAGLAARLCVGILAVLAVSAGAVIVAGAAPALNVQVDGSRAKAVHRIDPYGHVNPFPDEDPVDGKPLKPAKIDPNAKPVMPVSMKNTCGQCHDYDKIRAGWHFNAANPGATAGRPGEPWILYDGKTGTQAPLSYRKWTGTFRPEQFGVSRWRRTMWFGGHSTGGGVSEPDVAHDEDLAIHSRWTASGALDINCLGCHSADPKHDQSVWAMQVSQQNFLGAAAAAADLITIHGAVAKADEAFDPFAARDDYNPGPTVSYNPGRIDAAGKMFFNVGKPSSDRCYYCHSDRYVGPDVPEQAAHADEDVHLAAGMECIDCHRNEIGHKISRGVQGEGHETLTCRGCHLGVEGEGAAGLPGRLGAPRPKHAGLPPVHMKKLSCTACHSGPWPGKQAYRVQTSRSHRMGAKGVYRGEDSPPYIAAPVFRRQDNGVIAPHKMLWPSYWGRLRKGQVVPIGPKEVVAMAEYELETAGKVADKLDEAGRPVKGLNEQQIIATLKKIASVDRKALADAKADAKATGDPEVAIESKGEPVYISGGWLHSLDAADVLTSREHDAAKPYGWALAHGVRPAGRALGSSSSRGCRDCHSADAPFCFGEAIAEGPAVIGTPTTVRMHELQGLNGAYLKSLALSFEGRVMFKVYGFVAAGVVAVVLIVYGFFGLAGLLRRNRPAA